MKKISKITLEILGFFQESEKLVLIIQTISRQTLYVYMAKTDLGKHLYLMGLSGFLLVKFIYYKKI